MNCRSRRRKGESMSKPGSSINPGISSKVTCLLLLRHSAYRQRELNTGIYVEQENQSLSCQEKTSSRGHCKRESIDGQHWGGSSRISDDSYRKIAGAKGSCYPSFFSWTKTVRQPADRRYENEQNKAI